LQNKLGYHIKKNVIFTSFQRKRMKIGAVQREIKYTTQLPKRQLKKANVANKPMSARAQATCEGHEDLQ
jgi:hypothetical protein